jgi:hypothetical protein
MIRSLLLLLATAIAAVAYTPPVGIPDPADYFGWEIDRATPSWPASWTAQPSSATAGFYYIDSTASNSTDTSNTYGHPGLPRKTIPVGITLAAGSMIYIHAGTYTTTGRTGSGGRYNWGANGTSENPVWITGNPASRPIIQDLVGIGIAHTVSYLVFENIEISGKAGGGIDVRTAAATPTSVDHLLIRNCKLQGTQNVADIAGITFGIQASTDPGGTYTYMVAYSNEVSDFGVALPAAQGGTDEGGILIGYHSDYTWVLDNVIYHVGSDSVAGSHYSNYTDRLSEHYFIGRNTCYGNGENGIDVKGTRYVVIAENEIYGPFAREQGWGIVLHYGFSTSFHDRDVWVLRNKIYHVSGGINTGSSSGADNLNIVGNRIYDVRASYAVQADSLNGYCVYIGGSSGSHRVVDNTFYDYDSGIYVRGLSGSDTLKIHGNIFNGRADVNGHEIYLLSGMESFVTTNYNWYPSSARFFWNNSLRALSYMQGTAGQDANSQEGDPLFVSAATGNLAIQKTSPCKDASVEGPVGDSAYDAFNALFSIPIKYDFTGKSRHQGASWDIGSDEYEVIQTASNVNASTLVLP